MNASLSRKADIARHPCFSSKAHQSWGRIHLPVSPKCNIQCRFCKRTMNKKECRPGVANELLTPEKAIDVVAKALELCPEITVAGIAGPGDALASDHAIATFRLLRQQFPQLIQCLSTNGLLLKEKAPVLAEVGVRTITVTVNAIEVRVLEKICSHILFNGQYMTGETAARWLIVNQLAGIAESVRLGMIVKVNTVLIPGVNDKNIADIAKATAEVGAAFMNIIPLIPQHEFRNHQPPSARELQQAQAAAEKYLTVFRHCQQCRADACGIPGSGIELAQQVYGWDVPALRLDGAGIKFKDVKSIRRYGNGRNLAATAGGVS